MGEPLQARQVKVDSKGRIVIPSELRETISDVLTLRETDEGILIAASKPFSFEKRFRKIIESKPKRTGTPENWPPRRMKRIWAEGG